MKLSNFFKITKAIKNWYDYLVDFWLKREGIFKYKMNDGNSIFISPTSDDRYILNEIYVHNIYNPHGFEFNKGDTIIDIGAHKGIFSCYASKRIGNGQVFAFEPANSNFKELVNHVSINHLKNVKTFNLAVSNKSGKNIFFVANSPRYSGRHSLYKPAEEADKISVNTISLADIMKRNNLKKIDFLKMDCEGAEYNILLKANKKLLATIDKISMEYHNLDNEKNVLILKVFLEKNGFNVFSPNLCENNGLMFIKNEGKT